MRRGGRREGFGARTADTPTLFRVSRSRDVPNMVKLINNPTGFGRASREERRTKDSLGVDGGRRTASYRVFGGTRLFHNPFIVPLIQRVDKERRDSFRIDLVEVERYEIYVAEMAGRGRDLLKPSWMSHPKPSGLTTQPVPTPTASSAPAPTTTSTARPTRTTESTTTVPAAAAAAAPMQHLLTGGWGEYKTKKGKTYYFNSFSKKSQFNKPSELMSETEQRLPKCDWKEYVKQGKSFFYNAKSKTSLWEEPMELTMHRERLTAMCAGEAPTRDMDSLALYQAAAAALEALVVSKDGTTSSRGGVAGAERSIWGPCKNSKVLADAKRIKRRLPLRRNEDDDADEEKRAQEPNDDSKFQLIVDAYQPALVVKRDPEQFSALVEAKANVVTTTYEELKPITYTDALKRFELTRDEAAWRAVPSNDERRELYYEVKKKLLAQRADARDARVEAETVSYASRVRDAEASYPKLFDPANAKVFTFQKLRPLIVDGDLVHLSARRKERAFAAYADERTRREEQRAALEREALKAAFYAVFDELQLDDFDAVEKALNARKNDESVDDASRDAKERCFLEWRRANREKLAALKKERTESALNDFTQDVTSLMLSQNEKRITIQTKTEHVFPETYDGEVVDSSGLEAPEALEAVRELKTFEAVLENTPDGPKRVVRALQTAEKAFIVARKRIKKRVAACASSLESRPSILKAADSGATLNDVLAIIQAEPIEETDETIARAATAAFLAARAERVRSTSLKKTKRAAELILKVLTKSKAYTTFGPLDDPQTRTLFAFEHVVDTSVRDRSAWKELVGGPGGEAVGADLYERIKKVWIKHAKTTRTSKTEGIVLEAVGASSKRKASSAAEADGAKRRRT